MAEFEKDYILTELARFAQISFDEATHTYSLDGQQLISVTTLLANYQKPFDEEYWAKRKAGQLGIDAQQIIDEWRTKRQIAALRGSNFHSYLENRLTRTLQSPELLACPHLEPLKLLADKFYVDIQGRMEPIVSEFIIGDSQHRIAGTIDQLFFNHKSGQLEIWDWKTNSKFNIHSNYRLINGFEHLADCELTVYSLQLLLYRHLIIANTGLNIGNCYLAWFNSAHNDYKIFRCLELVREIEQICQRHKDTFNLFPIQEAGCPA